MSYVVRELFYSVQGEGVRAGCPSVFVRFAGCNQKCALATHGFDCDTDYSYGDRYSLSKLMEAIGAVAGPCRWVVLTGGEPTLQVDRPLLEELSRCGYHVAMETNGTNEVLFGVEWVTVSPKTPVAQLKQRVADEVKFVLAPGQPLPDVRAVRADHYLISPAFKGDHVDMEAVQWCVKLVTENPEWRLSLQTHKWIGVR